MSPQSIDEILSLGSDAGRGNLLGVQPYMLTTDYAAGDSFYTRLDGYLQAARQLGWIGEKTVVVWPELIGAWLVAAGESPKVFQGRTVAAAMRPLAWSHLAALAVKLVSAREKDRLAASLFRLKASQMAGLYQAAFSRLAGQYAVTVMAGSIFLPSPYVEHGQVRAGGRSSSSGGVYKSNGVSNSGELYNTAVVFRPDGTAHERLARKCFPIASERGFVAAAPLDDLPVFETPAGRLGVLVCADSWYPQAYARLKSAGAEMVAVPSLAAGSGIWDKPWGGYNGMPPPDVDPADVGGLTEGQAWHKYALRSRIGSSGARCGVNVFLHGELWDLGADNGYSLGVCGDEAVEACRNKSGLINVWI
jgi:hypothetical protein